MRWWSEELGRWWREEWEIEVIVGCRGHDIIC